MRTLVNCLILKKPKGTLAVSILLGSAPWVCAQHGHLNVGASAAEQGAPLIWANGPEFIDASHYVKTLEWADAGRYAGTYQGGITLTVLAATPEHAGPDPQAPALGAYIHFRLQCWEGPVGGEFQFWDSTGTVPVASLAPGESGTNWWVLSENGGGAGTDPFGHIHGRRFTATRPGIYKVAFQAVDLSTNGENGGPIHGESEVLPVWFQAGVTMAAVEPDADEGHVHIQFGAQAGYLWQVQYRSSLDVEANWMTAGNPITGHDLFVEFIHDLPPGARRFYRLMGIPVIP